MRTAAQLPRSTSRMKWPNISSKVVACLGNLVSAAKSDYVVSASWHCRSKMSTSRQITGIKATKSPQQGKA
ncbi:hypothetical protein LY78DRAFT_663253 [Colletotrichum sublineola]|nr:hypothetical protein LY78DRAFT_663253 [Colletotrichum sublineola]